MFERFTEQARRAVDLAHDEAGRLNDNYIGTEHILLGLIREGSGVAAQVLVKLGADLNRARQQVVQLLHGYHGEDVTSEGPPLPDDAVTRVDLLDRRLAAIERWAGLRADLDDLDQEIARVCREKEAAVDSQDFGAAAALRDQAFLEPDCCRNLRQPRHSCCQQVTRVAGLAERAYVNDGAFSDSARWIV